MDKLKDFFYNKNDVLVGVLIVLVAVVVIYFRINAIMDYPETLEKAQSEQQVEQTTKTDK